MATRKQVEHVTMNRHDRLARICQQSEMGVKLSTWDRVYLMACSAVIADLLQDGDLDIHLAESPLQDRFPRQAGLASSLAT